MTIKEFTIFPILNFLV